MIHFPMHRRMAHLRFWTTVLATSPIGCGSDAHAVFDKMHDAACSGDADKFFVYVDEERLVTNMMKQYEGSAPPNVLSVTDPSRVEFLRRVGVRSALDQWRKDVNEKGRDGDLCGWTFVRTEKLGDRQRVEVRSKAGNRKLLYFAKGDAGLTLVDFRAMAVPSGGGDHNLRDDGVVVAKDQTGTVEVHGDIRGKEWSAAAVAGGGAGYVGGISYEAVLNSTREQIGQSDGAAPLTDEQLSAPLRHASFVDSCGAPKDMKVQVRVAIRLGRALGVTVATNPANGGVAGCIDRAVRQIQWAESPKTDFLTTNY
ncbi:MAG TPA: hypothetical protein VGM06_08310 [Polyangiaceae bacterium]